MAQTAHRGLRTLLIWLLASASAFAGDAERRTEVVVIGTVHKGTANFTKDTLARTLERLKPALILFEVDSSFIDKDSQQLLERYRKMTLEAEAVTAFQAKSHVPLRAYDVEGRNQIYQERHYFELQTELSQAVGDLYRQDKLSPEAKTLLETILALDRIRDAIGQDRPEVINSSASDAAIEQKQHYAQTGMKRIIELTPSLARFADYCNFNAEFWDRRNKTMVANVIKQARDFPGKRVIVLCGFEHRYLLVRLLRAEERRSGISLREYWSYPPQ